jgi:hypothetical protein
MIQHIRAAFRLSVSALAFGAATALAPAALASDTYPGAVQSALGTCNIQCTLCHQTLAGGPGQLNTNFGEAIQATADLSIRQPSSIPTALQRMEEGPCLENLTAMPVPGPCDSDADGMGDVAELRAGRDPNVSGEGNLCGGPTYGCGARVARGGSDFDWAALLIAGAAAAALIAGARRSSRLR